MEPVPNHITDFMRSQKAPEPEALSPKKSKDKEDRGAQTLDAVFAGSPREDKKSKKKKKKDKANEEPETTAARRAAREAKALEAAQRSVGAIPDGTQGPTPSPHPISSDSSREISSTAAATPHAFPALAAAEGNGVHSIASEGKKVDDPASPFQSSASGGAVQAGSAPTKNADGEGGESDEDFFGPFASKKPASVALKPAPSALFNHESPREEEKVGVNFDEDLSLGGTAITRIAGLSLSQKRSISSKNLNLLARGGSASNVKETELTRAGELEIEEGKVIKGWKKVKAVLKNNKLVLYDKSETTVSLDEVLRYEEVVGKERVFLVQLKDTKDGTIYLRAKTATESADWLKAIKTSVTYHQSIFVDPTLPEVLIILSCKREPSNPISFTFQQFGSQDRVYMTMIGALLLELLLQDRIKIQKQKLLPSSDPPRFTGDSLFDDVISYLAQAYAKDKKAGGISVREFIKISSNLKATEPILGDVWRRAVVRATRKKYVDHQGGQKFVIRNEELETQCIDLIRNMSFKPGAVPSGPRELCIFALSYAVIRTFRKSPHEQNVIQKQNIFQSDEIRTKVHVNSMQASMDRFSKGVGTVPETIAASIREVCAGCYYCGRGE